MDDYHYKFMTQIKDAIRRSSKGEDFIYTDKQAAEISKWLKGLGIDHYLRPINDGGKVYWIVKWEK